MSTYSNTGPWGRIHQYHGHKCIFRLSASLPRGGIMEGLPKAQVQKSGRIHQYHGHKCICRSSVSLPWGGIIEGLPKSTTTKTGALTKTNLQFSMCNYVGQKALDFLLAVILSEA